MKVSHFIRRVVAGLCLLLATAGGCAQGTDYTPKIGQAGKDVVWAPTSQALVDTMLNMARVTSSDYVIDLGSGDGRIVISAAKRGAMALGIEYNPDMVELARRSARKEGVSAGAKFERADIFESDFSKATVLSMFLLDELNLALRPKILDMKPGTRVVSNSFGMGDWEPDETTTIITLSESNERLYHTAHFWIVPAKVHGTWQLDNGRICFIQEFQKITGTLTLMGKDMELAGKLAGDRISFNAGGTEYTGIVSGDAISGTQAGGEPWKAAR